MTPGHYARNRLVSPASAMLSQPDLNMEYRAVPRYPFEPVRAHELDLSDLTR